MAPSLVKAPPMAPFASKAAGAFWSVGFWPLGGESVSMVGLGCLRGGEGGVCGLMGDVRGCLVGGVGAAHCCGFWIRLVEVEGDVLVVLVMLV